MTFFWCTSSLFEAEPLTPLSENMQLALADAGNIPEDMLKALSEMAVQEQGLNGAQGSNNGQWNTPLYELDLHCKIDHEYNEPVNSDDPMNVDDAFQNTQTPPSATAPSHEVTSRRETPVSPDNFGDAMTDCFVGYGSAEEEEARRSLGQRRGKSYTASPYTTTLTSIAELTAPGRQGWSSGTCA